MEVTFHNLTVTLAGVASPKEAYNELCRILASYQDKGNPYKQIEWESDSYSYSDAGGLHGGDTSELWPEVP